MCMYDPKDGPSSHPRAVKRLDFRRILIAEFLKSLLLVFFLLFCFSGKLIKRGTLFLQILFSCFQMLSELRQLLCHSLKAIWKTEHVVLENLGNVAQLGKSIGWESSHEIVWPRHGWVFFAAMCCNIYDVRKDCFPELDCLFGAFQVLSQSRHLSLKFACHAFQPCFLPRMRVHLPLQQGPERLGAFWQTRDTIRTVLNLNMELGRLHTLHVLPVPRKALT